MLDYPLCYVINIIVKYLFKIKECQMQGGNSKYFHFLQYPVFIDRFNSSKKS